MSVNFDKVSIVQWYNSAEKHRCGYCKNQFGSISNGMWAETLTVDDYQDLIDRGWRRSGKYCYKPIMDETCCPQYTIKCDALDFAASKSQKKVIKKFNRYLEDGRKDKCETPLEHTMVPEGGYVEEPKERPNINISSVLGSNVVNCITDSLAAGEPHNKLEKEPVSNERKADSSEQKCRNKESAYKGGVGRDPSKPPCKKAKLIRLEKKKEKLLSKGEAGTRTVQTSNQKSLEDFINDVSQNSKFKLKITIERMSGTHQKFQESAKLFQKYQMIIHNDPPSECDEECFSNFLVYTPLKPKKFPNNVEGPGYGSFHQQYWLDEKLIAVGVIDILPRCVSSVYFFYDPDYRSLTLGTLGSLREIHFTRSLTPQLPELKWYYMGFYIHSCPKMAYKGRYSPSYLLCPESYHWIPIERCIPLLDERKYSCLNTDLDALDENQPNQHDISNMKVICDNTLMPFVEYKKRCRIRELSEDVAILVGAKCTRSLVFWI